jgi:hypothetical protein
LVSPGYPATAVEFRRCGPVDVVEEAVRLPAEAEPFSAEAGGES